MPADRPADRPAANAADLIAGFRPENELEAAVAADPQLVEGLAWGKPRRGHPEGSIAAHVEDLLERIDQWGETGRRRSDLRFVALVHDACKKWVHNWRPRNRGNHHAARARRLAERYTDDPRLLSTIELHDRPYNLWKKMRPRAGPVRRAKGAGERTRVAGRRGSDRRIDEALDRMLDRVADMDLFMRFVELDGSTEGKNPAPIEWFREELRRRGLLSPKSGDAG